MTENAPKSWTLDPKQEFRFEIEAKQVATITILEGQAELFGTELALGVEYKFTARKLAIFTWQGCRLEAASSSGELIAYVGSENPMSEIINVHFALERTRFEAKAADEVGPRIMIVGPSDVGKTTLAKILVSYAARNRSFPILCDIDPNGGLISVAETVSAMAIHRPIDPEEELNAPVTLYKTTPITYYYGSTDIKEKSKVYSSYVSCLAKQVSRKLEDKLVKHAGIIIDTPAQFLESGGFDLLTEAIEGFKVNIILVIGHERLLSDLQRKYSDKNAMTILKLNKSGGVVSRDKTIRRHMQLQRVKEYFYGTLKTELTPFSQTVSFSDIIVRRVAEGSIAPSSTLPIGMEANPHEIKFNKVDDPNLYLHSVLAISYTPLPGSIDPKDPTGKPKLYTPEEEIEALLSTNVCGFVYVSEVDDAKRKMTILSPSPNRLPKTFYIVGGLKWLDQ